MKTTVRNALLTYMVLALLAACSGNPTTQVKNPGLKDALKDKFLIGTALNRALITGTDSIGVRVVTQHFNSIVAEDCMKSQVIHPEEDRYDFTLSDAFVDFGTRHGMQMVGHTLIWHSQLSKWFCHDENGELVTPDVLKTRMKHHIHTVVGRYKGKIAGWDVVNEAINDDGSWRQTPFYRILGEEYLYLAFQYAHEADPNAELYYNDYNEWHPGRRDAVVELINSLKEKGLRIDAVGMQGHIGMDYPPLDQYQKAIDAYTSTGVKVMITELEMSALPIPRPNVGANISDIEAYKKEMDPYIDGLPADASEAWNNRMMDVFNLFLKNSDVITRVTLWGVSDRDSWKNNFPIRGRTDYPLLFDRNYQPKPVVQRIIDAATNKQTL